MKPTESLLQKVQALNKEKKFQEVIDALPDVILDAENSADLYGEKAQAYYRLDQKEESKKMAEMAVTIQPNHAKGLYIIGSWYGNRKENDKALEYFQKGIVADPNYAYPYYGMGNVYADRKENDKAIEYFQKAIAIDPNFAYPYNGMGSIYRSLKEYDKATEYCQKAIAADPYFASTYNSMGLIYHDRKEYDKAIEYYQKAIAVEPNYAQSLYNMGLVYSDRKEYDKAIEYYQKAIAAGPNYAYPCNGMGNVHLDQKEYDKAIKYYQKAIATNPDFAGPYYNLGLAYKAKSNYPEAQKAFKKYITLTGSNPDDYSLWAKNHLEEIKKILQGDGYSEIKNLVEEIKNLLHFPKGCITHYTSLSAAKFIILGGSKFRLSEGAFLNDTSEGRDLFKFLDFHFVPVNNHGTTAEPFSRKPFIGSFVKENKHDDLTLWRMYGKEAKDEAKGCAITLDMEKLQTLLKETTKSESDKSGMATPELDFKFYKVAYRRDGAKEFLLPGAEENEVNQLNDVMKRLEEAVTRFKESEKQPTEESKRNMVELLNQITYLFKAAEYEYEHEIRLVIDSTIGFDLTVSKAEETPRVYIEIGDIRPLITKLTLGPKVDRADEWASVFYYSFKELYIKTRNDGALPDIYISHLPFK